MGGVQGAGFKLLDSESYDAHAEAYGRHIERLGGPVVAELCARAPVRAGDRVLDVGAGTGVGTRAAATLAGPTGSVLGVDLSPGMVETAGSVPAPEGSAPITFKPMDAEALALEDSSFDCVVSLFAALHFPDPAAACAEMRRAVKPGGRVLVAIGSPRPTARPQLARHVIRRLADEAMGLARPRLRAPGLVTKLAKEAVPEPPERVLSTWDSSDQPRTIVDSVKAAGLSYLGSGWVGHETVYTSAEDYWDANFAIVTEARKRLVQADPEVTERVREEFLRRARKVLDRGGKLVYPHGAFFARAERPLEA
jgi:ubiquinone/menaquinone biosynthesis C-methylase UbiE